MNSHAGKLALLLVALIVGTPSAFAANVALRARSNHQGTMVRLGDIADISAASTTELNNLSTMVLLPAPAPGTLQFLRRSQIRDLLAAHGVDLGAISLSGAEVVEVGASKAKPQVDVAAPEKEAVPAPSRQEIESSLHASIKQYLSEQTGHDRWRIEVPLDTAAYLRLANLGFELTASGGRKPYTGRQYFQVTGEAADQEMIVVATVTRIQPAVTALRKIEQGELIRAADLEVREHEGNLPSTAISTLSEAVGMEARRSISEGTILQTSQLSAPLLVERGETVTVFARTAGITVRTFAVARQDGAQGELVQVETLDRKDRFMARVSGRRELEVLATGATASDFASLPRHEATRR
jgi:flagellar basal body P-ring formation protein FlgA